MLNKTIYVNGCSFVWGYDSVPGITLSKEANQYSFANFLGATKVYNDAYPGSSNAGIVTRTVDWINNNTIPDIAIFGWSSHNRMLLPTATTEHKDRLGQHILKYTETYDINEDDMRLHTVSHILTLDAYLTSLNITTFHFSAFHNVYHPYLDSIKNRWLWPHTTWADEYEMSTYDKTTNKVYHPSLNEHKRFAQDLKEFINEQN